MKTDLIESLAFRLNQLEAMEKAGRNDPCPCGSGLKFKKCCEMKATRGRLTAARVTLQAASQVKKISSLASLFGGVAQLQETRVVEEKAGTLVVS